MNNAYVSNGNVEPTNILEINNVTHTELYIMLLRKKISPTITIVLVPQRCVCIMVKTHSLRTHLACQVSFFSLPVKWIILLSLMLNTSYKISPYGMI